VSAKKKHGGDVASFIGGQPTERALSRVHELVDDMEFNSIEQLNTFFAENINGPMREATNLDTPEKRAQELVYDAWDASSDNKAHALAEEALEIDPDCPDALHLLAQLTEDGRVAVRLSERAVSAAERRLGPTTFEEHAGKFWGLFKTRPYMRARFGLAQALWDMGDETAAIEHAQAVMELNPSDNQGVRHVLVGWLLYHHEKGAAAKLLRQFDEDSSAVMQWARALQRFQAFGRTEASDDALDDALIANPAVAFYLLGMRECPDELPDGYSIGGEDEAVYADFLLSDAWYDTSGALEWLVCFLEEARDRHMREGSLGDL